jgi:hypothetical protein
MYRFTEEQFAHRIEQVYGVGYENARRLAKEATMNAPQKFSQNICEWIEGKKLTDIYAGQYSIPMIMAIWNRQDFLEALAVAARLEKGEIESAESQIWNMRR